MTKKLPEGIALEQLRYLLDEWHLTQRQIGEIYGVSRRVVLDWCRIAGLKMRQGRPAKARAMTREELDARAADVVGRKAKGCKEGSAEVTP